MRVAGKTITAAWAWSVLQRLVAGLHSTRRRRGLNATPALPHLVTEDDVRAAYRLLFSREPDPDGWHNYTALVGRAPTSELVGALVSSEEFRRTPMYRAMTRQEHSDLERVDIGDGLSLLVSPHDLLAAPLLETGVYEAHLARALDAAIRPGQTVYCVGANLGYHAVRAARTAGSGGRVVALEPNPRTARQLCLNFALNGLSNAVVLPLAASDREMRYRYVPAQGTNGYVEAADATALATTAASQPIVQSVAIDTLARAWAPVDVLQLDVEGAEGLVLRGAAETLRRDRPLIFSELCLGQLRRTSGIEGRELLAPLVGLGYELSVIGFDGAVMRFGGDADALVAHAARQPTSHVDIRCEPRPLG